MKLRTERDSLLDAITNAGRAVTLRGASGFSTPSVKLRLRGNRLEVTGSDSDLVITTRTGVIGETDGEALVPARLVQEIIRSFEPGVVAIDADEEEVRISSGRAQFSVREPVGAELSLLGKADGAESKLPTQLLAEGLRQVVRAALADDSRAPQLSGVLMVATPVGLRLVATDSYRLAFRDLRGVEAFEAGGEVLVPARALTELQRLASSAHSSTDAVGFQHSDLDAIFDLGEVKLTTRLLQGPFPDYERLLPDRYDKAFVVDREQLGAAVRRVRLLLRDTKDSASPVRISLSKDCAELNVVTTESGHAIEQVEGSYDGEDILVAFNPSYLLDGVEAIRSERVILEVIDSSKPATIRGEQDDDYRYLLMPVRVS